MTVTQTVEIPASRRLTIDVPCEVPTGKTILTFTPASSNSKVTTKEKMSEAQEIELINLNAERLNQEALDVLSYQKLDL